MTIKQPVSTFTSLLFNLAGILISILYFDPIGVLAFNCLGTGSFFHHADGAQKNTQAHLLDVLSIYGLSLALAYHVFQLPDLAFVFLTFAFAGHVLLFRKLELFIMLPIYAVVISVGLFLRLENLFATLAIVLPVLYAFIVRRFFEDKDWAHGVFWHVPMAVTTFFAWILT